MPYTGTSMGPHHDEVDLFLTRDPQDLPPGLPTATFTCTGTASLSALRANACSSACASSSFEDDGCLIQTPAGTSVIRARTHRPGSLWTQLLHRCGNNMQQDRRAPYFSARLTPHCSAWHDWSE